jgi:hypothetical protein
MGLMTGKDYFTYPTESSNVISVTERGEKYYCLHKSSN